MNVNHIVHQGWLKKAPPLNKGVRSRLKHSRVRMFRLFNDTKLVYYQDEDCKMIRGEILLKHVVSVEEHELGFVLHTPSRDWHLTSVLEQPESRAADVKAWIKAVTETVPDSMTKRSSVEDAAAALATEAAADAGGGGKGGGGGNSHVSGGRRSSSSIGSGTTAAIIEQLGNPLTTYVRHKVSQKKYRFVKDGFDLDLCYITDRVIAMGFPSQGMEGMYRNPLDQVQRFFHKYHAGHYKLWNLCSERSYDEALFEGRVKCVPFNDHCPPKMAQFDEFCESMREHLGADEKNVAAVHCKAGKGRTGTMICAYLLFSGAEPTAAKALEFYGVMRTSNGHGVTIPSQRRYVGYYEQQLKEGPAKPRAFRVVGVSGVTVPRFDRTGGCNPYFKVYIDTTKIFDYRKNHKVKAVRRKEPGFNLDPNPDQPVIVCGDVQFVFFDQDTLTGDEKMCWAWLCTSYIRDGDVVLRKQDLDGAVNKDRFDDDFKITITFQSLDNSEGITAGALTKRAMTMAMDEGDVDSLVSSDEVDLGEEDDGDDGDDLLKEVAASAMERVSDPALETARQDIEKVTVADDKP